MSSQKTYETVWYYKAFDEDMNRYWRKVFFRAGSVNYLGSWMGPSDCVWMVPCYGRWE